MYKTIIKFYMDYRKEEVWLNEMASKGLSLHTYSPFRYVFKKTEPGKYQYKIDLLDNLPSHPESENYIEFLDENGVELIGTHYRWILVRKLNDGTDFNLNTTTEAKMSFYKRYLQMVVPIWLVNIMFVLTNLLSFHSHGQGVSMFAVAVNSFVALMLGIMVFKVYKMYNIVKTESSIYE